MRHKKLPSKECHINDSFIYTCDFFYNNTELVHTFDKICQHMLELEPEILFRTNSEIIGVAKHGQFYRFYISLKNGEYFIKYKHQTSAELFIPEKLEVFLSNNILSKDFFDEKYKAREKRKAFYNSKTAEISEDIWQSVKSKASAALELSVSPYNHLMLTDKTYREIVEILTRACLDSNIMSERNGDILIHRVLKYRVNTLQNLAEKHGVSRQCIAQNEAKAWKRLSNSILYISNKKYKAAYIPYQSRIKSTLLDIPDEAFISVVIRIYKINPIIGEWIKQIITTSETRLKLEWLIKEYSK